MLISFLSSKAPSDATMRRKLVACSLDAVKKRKKKSPQKKRAQHRIRERPSDESIRRELADKGTETQSRDVPQSVWLARPFGVVHFVRHRQPQDNIRMCVDYYLGR